MHYEKHYLNAASNISTQRQLDFMARRHSRAGGNPDCDAGSVLNWPLNAGIPVGESFENENTFTNDSTSRNSVLLLQLHP